jgi:hypothetical protein
MLAALKSRFGRAAPGEGEDAPDDPAAPTPALEPLAPLPEEEDEPFVLRVFDCGEVCFEQPFRAGEIVIGASPECDIVVADLDVSEVATLRLEHIGSACLFTLTALSEGVEARGRELPVGHPLVFTERAAFRIAEDYEFDAFYAPTKNPIATPGSLPLLLLAGAALLAAAAWTIGQPAPRPVIVQETVPSAALAPAASPPAAAPPAPSVEGASIRRPEINDVQSPRARIALAEADLRARLVSGNLIPPLRVGSRDTTLLVAGAVTADERARLVDVLAGFRERVEVPIEMTLESEPRAAPFFTAVVLEPEAFVIGADGRRYRIDQRLPDGGVIETIDDESIVVNRDGLRERINYSR